MVTAIERASIIEGCGGARREIGQPEADIEDVLGVPLYVELANACYSLKKGQAASVPPAAGRVVKHVEEHFRTLPDTVAEFDHYAPASYLTEHRASVLKKVTDEELEAALARFEKMFSDINALL